MQKSNSLGQTCMEWQTESFFFLGWQRYMDIPTKFLLPRIYCPTNKKVVGFRVHIT